VDFELQPKTIPTRLREGEWKGESLLIGIDAQSEGPGFYLGQGGQPADGILACRCDFQRGFTRAAQFKELLSSHGKGSPGMQMGKDGPVFQTQHQVSSHAQIRLELDGLAGLIEGGESQNRLLIGNRRAVQVPPKLTDITLRRMKILHVRGFSRIGQRRGLTPRIVRIGAGIE